MIHTQYIDHVPVQCIKQSAQKNHISPKILAAVLETEGGRSGEASRNKNGTYDYGAMQINTTWLPTLHKMGYSTSTILNNTCKNVDAGAWLLRKALASSNSFWVGVGNYNSHNPYYNARYRQAVYRHYQQIKFI